MLVWSDGVAYFLYARSLVIDYDTDLTNDYESIADSYSSRSLESFEANLRYAPDGKQVVVPWPPGSGLIMAPFYAAGYAVELIAANIAGRPPDSYGTIPQFFFAIGALAYGFLGFWATFFICRDYANAGTACLGTLATFFAGTAVFYVFLNPSMAHAASFGLVSLLTLLWFRQWHDGISLKLFAVFSLLLGLLITVRFQNVIFGLLALPLLARHLSSGQHIPLVRLLLSGLLGLIPLSLLVLHATNTAGSDTQIAWANGVVTIGEVPIDLKSPYFFDVLFACRHGAFHWSPVFAIGTLGLIVAAARRDTRALALLMTLAAQVYLIGGLGMLGSAVADGAGSPNWNNHWAGGTSFGMRYLTECTPFFAFGVATLLSAFTNRLRWLLTAALFMLVGWNLLLILAYGLNKVSRSYCVTYADMWTGIGDALRTLLSMLS